MTIYKFAALSMVVLCLVIIIVVCSGAFQSIEAVVTAVTSVANMLNSTQNAIYSSFRAVIGVVEQFSRLKSQVI